MKLLAGIFIVSLLAGCSQESRVRGQFLSSCTSTGMPKSVCSCMFDKITESYSVKELEAFDQQARVLPEAFAKVSMDAALVCRNK